MKSYLWQAKIISKFSRRHAPLPHSNPPRLACAFKPRFNLRRLLCFIGHLWKLLLRTLIIYQDHKDQETAPWRGFIALYENRQQQQQQQQQQLYFLSL